MTTVFPFQVNNRLIKLFEKATVAHLATIKSGTFGVGRSGRAILWIKLANKSASPSFVFTMYDVLPGLDSQQDAAAPASKVAHGSAITLTDNGVSRTEFGSDSAGRLGNCCYLEGALGGTGTIDCDAWLELLD